MQARFSLTTEHPELDGVWIVRREAGLLPPLVGVRKRIAGARGHTSLGPVRAGFDVVGRELRYRGVLRGFVDVLEPADGGWAGRATAAGRQYGRFRLVRASSGGD
jgi:hypothetical protein